MSDLPPIAAQYLLDRGIKLETAFAHRFELCGRLTNAVYSRRLGFEYWGDQPLETLVQESLWSPCPDSTGTIKSWFMRGFPPLPEAKFLTPKNGGGYPFIPLDTWRVKDKVKEPLYITEGPFKSLAILQAAALPIGIAGVWMASGKLGGTHSTTLHPLLARSFTWRNRQVFLAFDADYELNPSVRQALIRTIILLHKAGTEVRILRWPISQGKGIDDHLYLKGGGDPASLLKALSAQAVEFPEILNKYDLENIELELGRAGLKGSRLKQLCRMVSKPLLVDAATLFDEVSTAQQDRQTDLKTAMPQPWAEEVNGSELLDELADVVRRHVVISETQAGAIALWVLLTYLEPYVDILPMLAVSSAEKRCGKTVLLALLSKLASKPLTASNMSSAVIYRVIERLRPTLLVDECDTWLKENEECRGVINSGHSREMAFVWRANGDSGEPERFSTWSPKALAGIGKLADTLADRSIIIRLSRRRSDEQIQKLRDAPPDQFERLRQMALRWALDHGEWIETARPAIPDALDDRQGDNWFPLLAIADETGGVWPERARRLALVLSGTEDTETERTVLLGAIRDIFEQESEEFLGSLLLTGKLNADKIMPWADWAQGKGLTETKLAAILRDFGVKPKQLRKAVGVIRGYFRKELEPVFERYTPRHPPKTASTRDNDS